MITTGAKPRKYTSALDFSGCGPNLLSPMEPGPVHIARQNMIFTIGIKLMNHHHPDLSMSCNLFTIIVIFHNPKKNNNMASHKSGRSCVSVLYPAI